MKMSSKLYLLLPLVLLLIAMVTLTACSGGNSTTASTSTPTPTTKPTSTPTSTPMPTPTSAPTSTQTPSPTTTTPAATPQGVTINLTAQGMAFDMKTITVPAGAAVTMIFDNKDRAPHNFALYTDSSATKSIFVGQVVSSKTITYTFTAPTTPGSYFFRCDVHPTSMTGTFIVQ